MDPRNSDLIRWLPCKTHDTTAPPTKRISKLITSTMGRAYWIRRATRLRKYTHDIFPKPPFSSSASPLRQLKAPPGMFQRESALKPVIGGVLLYHPCGTVYYTRCSMVLTFPWRPVGVPPSVSSWSSWCRPVRCRPSNKSTTTRNARDAGPSNTNKSFKRPVGSPFQTLQNGPSHSSRMLLL